MPSGQAPFFGLKPTAFFEAWRPEPSRGSLLNRGRDWARPKFSRIHAVKTQKATQARACVALITMRLWRMVPSVQAFSACPNRVAGSTFTPGPMVEDTATRLM
jgi:hypothetical protein